MVSSPKKHKRKSLTEASDNLDITTSSPSLHDTAATMTSSTAPHMSLVRSMRTYLKSKFSTTPLSKPTHFTIRMNEQGYDYFYTDDDPDELFKETEGFQGEIAQILDTISDQGEDYFDDQLVHLLARCVFGSNYIERAGAGLDITIKLCQEIFRGNSISLINPRDKDYESQLQKFVTKEESSEPITAVLRSCLEVVQHAKALVYIMQEMVFDDKPLSESIILETHRILTLGIPSSDGDKSGDYGGKYRTFEVGAGLFSCYSATSLVPAHMRRMVQEFNNDINYAIKASALDPYELAAKYCHKFVNIHPFADGNGRTCRLILNAILFKYTGIIVPLGERDDDRNKYLEIAARGSLGEQSSQDDEEEKKSWKELSTFTLGHVKQTMGDIFQKLKGKHHKDVK